MMEVEEYVNRWNLEDVRVDAFDFLKPQMIRADPGTQMNTDFWEPQIKKFWFKFFY